MGQLLHALGFMSKMRIYCERPCKVWPNYAVDTHTTWTTQQKTPKTTTGPSKLLPSSITLKLKKIILCMVWHTSQQSQILNCSANAGCSPFPKKKNTMHFVCFTMFVSKSNYINFSRVKDKQASILRRLICEDILVSEIEH